MVKIKGLSLILFTFIILNTSNGSPEWSKDAIWYQMANKPVGIRLVQDAKMGIKDRKRFLLRRTKKKVRRRHSMNNR